MEYNETEWWRSQFCKTQAFYSDYSSLISEHFVGNVALRHVYGISHPIHHPLMFRVPLPPLVKCTTGLFSHHVITTSVLNRSLTSVQNLLQENLVKITDITVCTSIYICMYVCTNITSMEVEPENSLPLISLFVTEHDPELVPSTSHPHNIFF